MFYCDDCGTKNDWPTEQTGLVLPHRSIGPCEICKKVRSCYSVPASRLPVKRPEKPER